MFRYLVSKRWPCSVFLCEEAGAVNVDFVAITSLVLALCLFVGSLIHAGLDALSNDVGLTLGTLGVDTSFQPQQPQAPEPGPSGSTDNVPTTVGGGTTQGTTPSGGNPGNDKPVGNAGENPSGSIGGGNGNNGNGANNSGNTQQSTPTGGNPGNNKPVGNAGENPNGQGGFGSGSNGRSR